MARTQSQVLGELLDLAPPGSVFPRAPSSNWAGFLTPLAGAWADFETSADSMLPQVDPRSAPQFLGDFLRVLGADPCGRDAPSQNLSSAGLAQLAYQRWTQRISCRPADYVALAEAAGQPIAVEEFAPSYVGQAVCGAAACAQEGCQFSWAVTLGGLQTQQAQCAGAVCGDLIGSYVPNPLACVITRAAPAHTKPVFVYMQNYTPLDLVPNWQAASAIPGSGADWSVAATTALAPLLLATAVWLTTETALPGDTNAATFSFPAVVGEEYAVSVYLWLPAGAVFTQVPFFRGDDFTGFVVTKAADPSVTGAWQQITATGVATLASQPVVVAADGAVGVSFYLTLPNAQVGSSVTNFEGL